MRAVYPCLYGHTPGFLPPAIFGQLSTLTWRRNNVVSNSLIVAYIESKGETTLYIAVPFSLTEMKYFSPTRVKMVFDG